MKYIKFLDKDGLEYIKQFGKDGLEYILSFGAEGRDFLSKFNVDYIKILVDRVKKISDDIVKENNNKSDKTLENILNGASNAYALEIKKFIEADALDWIDVVSDFKDKDYFKEGPLTFCREYINYSSSYGFADKEYLFNKIKSFFGGGLAVNGDRSFSFDLSRDTMLWGNTIKAAGEEAFFSLKNLKPVKAGDVINIALKLLQNLKDVRISSNSAVRLFFKTNYEWLQIAAVVRENVSPTYYLVSSRPLLQKSSLSSALMNPKTISLDPSVEKLTFNLIAPDHRIADNELDSCLNIFIDQLLASLEKGRL